ncbi:amidohydrolase family protein [Sinanaerobacter chloroacetimidivorans]|uniref:Amidohydrolase family protein n=1 Tax=Sinanaerobacter chloroacetimidivorans TaxID=2818044 RepID=A0A8J8B083_9FIRM|nr:amidohydrolase family protein [Sinanaerobacter chloroacetimidivorans]MBR0596336.1 amidohydrolase family protein [Sinanaerobacter chloroacetimidivorans]
MKKRAFLSLVLAALLVLSSFGFAFADESYTVKSGDVLWKIAEKYQKSYQELAEYNKIKDPNLIYVNQVIQIPDSRASNTTSHESDSLPQPSSAVDPSEAADTILYNGTIYTMDEKNPVAEAVAVKGGKILDLGSKSNMNAYLGNSTKLVDLGGKIVMPGMIDAHVHAPGTALTELFEIYLYESITKEQTLADIQKFIKANPHLDEYWGTGYTVGMAGDAKGPKAEWLDEICPDKPVILTSNDGHNMWLNSKALEMNGITKATPNPPGGLIQKDPVTGELWGSITDASQLIKMEQSFTPEQESKALQYFQDSMHAWGYTGIMAIAPSFVNVERYKELEEKGELKLRVNLANEINNDEPFEPQLQELIHMRDTLDSDLIDVTTAKFFADGVVEGMTGYLLEPYDKAAGLEPDYVSEFYWNPDQLDHYFDRVMEEGFQIHVHSIGDAATRLVLDSLEYAQKDNSTTDNRNVITHLQVVDESDYPRFGELDIIAALQPFWHFKEPEWWEYVDKIALGNDRAWKEYPVKSLLDSGAVLTASGDHPVSPINNPFWSIEADVTRNLNNAEYYGVEDISDINDPTWLLNSAERVPVQEMVKAYTINGAYQLFREDTIGSIVKGKYADMIVVDQDIYKINPLDIDKTKVLTTIFNGEVVFGNYDYQ